MESRGPEELQEEIDLTDPTAKDRAYRSTDGFLLLPEKDRMTVVLAGFSLFPVLSWMER